MKTRTVLAATVFVLLAAPLLAVAQPRGGFGPGGGRFGPGRVERIGQELGLNPDQMQKVRAASTEFHRQRIRLGAQIEEARLNLREYLANERNVTEDRAREMVAAIGQIETQLHQARVTFLVRVRALLTPPQWRRALEMLEEHRDGPPGPPEGRGPMGPGRRPRGPFGGPPGA